MFKTIKTYVRKRRTYLELMALSDRNLKDLGITRADIYGIAFEREKR